MREILFRGKDPENDVWYKGQYIHLHKSTYCFKEDYDSFSDNDIHQIVFERMTDWGLPNRHLRADVDPATVGQYTGLDDKNGTKIFEGDIVLLGDGDTPALVEFSNFQWVCTCKTLHPFYLYHLENETVCEIIGNVYDNPELIKGR